MRQSPVRTSQEATATATVPATATATVPAPARSEQVIAGSALDQRVPYAPGAQPRTSRGRRSLGAPAVRPYGPEGTVYWYDDTRTIYIPGTDERRDIVLPPGPPIPVPGYSTVHLTMVPLDVLHVDMEYQRQLVPRKVKEIARDFSPVSAGVLSVSLRPDGILALMDGQHRVRAAQLREYTEWRAELYEWLPLEEEARIFSDFNSQRSRPDAHTLFRAQLRAGNREAQEIMEVLQEHGYTLVDSLHGTKGPNAIRAVDILRRIHRQGGKELLGEVLWILRNTWYGQAEATHQRVVGGVYLFIHKFRDRYDPDKLVGVMTRVGLQKVVVDAVARSLIYRNSDALSIARVLFEEYNSKSRGSSRLPDLFSSTSGEDTGTGTGHNAESD